MAYRNELRPKLENAPVATLRGRFRSNSSKTAPREEEHQREHPQVPNSLLCVDTCAHHLASDYRNSRKQESISVIHALLE
jgi:hypothetical protein